MWIVVTVAAAFLIAVVSVLVRMRETVWKNVRGALVTDWEYVRGVLVVLVVAGAVGTAVATLWLESWQPWQRVVLATMVLLAGTFIASTNWTRRSLRGAATIGVVALGLVVADIGRTAPMLQAGRSLDALSSSLDRIERAEKDKHAALATAKTKALETLKQSIDVVLGDNDELAARAVTIRTDLTNGADAKTLAGHIRELDAAYTPASATAAERKLRDDVDKAVTAGGEAAEPPSAESPRTAIADARKCSTAPDTGCPDGPDVALAIARLRVAAYRVAVLGREEDAAEVKTATARLAAARAAAVEAGGRRTLQNVLGDGVEEIAATLPLQDRDRPFILDSLGWLVVGGIIIALWRTVERRSAQQMPGPVETNFTGAKAASDAPGEDETAQKAAFRTALLQNLPEPAATPGAVALSSVTDLAELGGKTTPIARFFAALKGILVRPGGYVALADVIPPLNKGGEWAVLVRINDEWTGEQVAVRRLAGATAMRACNSAGLWAAATVLSRSTRIPTWAQWDESTAQALGAYHTAEAIADADLEAAVACAPSSGLLLHTLADRRELGGRYLDALVLYARAVAAHPRYPVARYRLAASLAAVAPTVSKHWSTAPMSARVRAVEHIKRACAALNLSPCALSAGAENPGDQTNAIAKEMYERIIYDNAWRNALPSLVRKSERAVWWPRFRTMFHRFGPRAAAQWMAKSAKLIVEGGDPSELTKVEKRASHRRSWWQLSYNLACYHARNGNPAAAVTWLETALQRPGSGQMGGGWLNEDPDLESIRNEPRFRAVAAQLAATAALAGGENAGG